MKSVYYFRIERFRYVSRWYQGILYKAYPSNPQLVLEIDSTLHYRMEAMGMGFDFAAFKDGWQELLGKFLYGGKR
jgi:hypothetical protein